MSETATGVLKLEKNQQGVLRDPARSLQSRPNDVAVARQLVGKYRLVSGASVSGPVRRGKRGRELAEVESVCGLPPEDFAARTTYKLSLIHI